MKNELERIGKIRARIREINSICINRMFTSKSMEEERDRLREELDQLKKGNKNVKI